MVSKSKLYSRLDSLEAELAERLVPHLARAAEGSNDLVFCVNGYHSFSELKQDADPITTELVGLGAEILTLKKKLGEPIEGSPAERICWYCREWGDSKKNCHPSAQKLAEQFLNEIKNA